MWSLEMLLRGCWDESMHPILLSVCLQWANIDNICFHIFALYINSGLTGGVMLHIIRWMSHKPFPCCFVPPSSKVLQSLILLPGLWEWGDGTLPSVQSVSQQAHKGPAASTTGNLAWCWRGHAFGLESIAFRFNQEMQLGIFFSPNDD